MIRKKNFAWWSKFNYVLSSSLDCGTVISIMVIFFTLQVGDCFFFFLVLFWILNDLFLYLVPERWSGSGLVGKFSLEGQ